MKSVSVPMLLSGLKNQSGLHPALRNLSPVKLLFLIVVALPTMASILYYGLMAKPRFVSEAQLIVRSVKSPKITGLDAIFRTFGMSSSDDDASAVQGYLESRDAVRDLEKTLPLRQFYSSEYADIFAKFPRLFRGETFEALYEYYLGRVTLIKSGHTGISTLRVVAFRPEDSQLIARTLIHVSEDLVNRMNERAQRDAMSSAQTHLERSQANVLEAQAKMTSFRNRELLVDPTSESLKLIELVGTLRADLAMASAQFDQSKATAPSGPGLQSLQARARALQDQINAETAKIAGNKEALASKISEFEALSLNRQFSEAQLMTASTSLESAIQDARRQQIYIEQVVSPNLPDEAIEPRRMRLIITVFVFSFTMFGMIWILFIGAKEHANG